MAIIDDLVDMEVFAKDPAQTQSFDQFLDGVVVISLDSWVKMTEARTCLSRDAKHVLREYAEDAEAPIYWK